MLLAEAASWSAFGGLFCIVPFILVAALPTIFWIWMLVDCVTKEPSEGNDKIIWILIILLTHFIGSLIYYFIRRPKRIEQYGQ